VHDNDPGLDASAPDQGLDVVAVGSAIVDVLSPSSDKDLERLGLVKGSMALVDLARAASLYEAMGPATEVSGGSAANTAAGVAALGGRSGYVGKVASDELGDVFLHDITAAGVVMGRTAPVALGRDADPDADLATGRCLVFVTEDGERTMATHLGAASTLGPADLDEELIARAQVVYLEGYLWDLGPAKTALRRAIEVAHGAEALVALTVSDPFCVQRHRAEFLELLRDDVDVLFANEEEALLLFGVDGFDDALSAVEETGLLAALTRGAKGSVVVTASGSLAIAAEAVERVIDTTGAGDLYAAGFLHGLTSGYGPEDSARLGGICAAEIISHIGARPHADLRRLAARAGMA
jgi:sugar/nucleoside kinase (ribokinase family)